MIEAYTNNQLRKAEYEKNSEEGIEIFNLIPLEILQGNEDDITLISDDGVIISVYFTTKCISGKQPTFDDLDYLHDNVELVSLKYIKQTGQHYYKYYVRFNPLNIETDNIVCTAFFTNDSSKVTIYTVPSLSNIETENERFYNESFKGITLNLSTKETIYETEYEPKPARPYRG